MTTAREHVRVARALGDLPLVDAAFASGKLSYSKVRAITRAATPATEQNLFESTLRVENFLDIAKYATASQIEKITAAYRRSRIDPSQPPGDLRRFLRCSTTASGMARIEIQLPPEQAKISRKRSSPHSTLAAARTLPRNHPPASRPTLPRNHPPRPIRSRSRPSAPMRWSASPRPTSNNRRARSAPVTNSSS
jgi:hypothetical protein